MTQTPISLEFACAEAIASMDKLDLLAVCRGKTAVLTLPASTIALV